MAARTAAQRLEPFRSFALLLTPTLLLVALLGLTAIGGSEAATCDQPRNVTLNKPMVSYLVNRIQLRFTQISTNDTEGKRYSPLVPGCIRLGFHMCAAKQCSSYVNLNDPNNNGLQPIVAIIDALRSSIVQQNPDAYDGLSKSDFYALCAIAAVEVATNYTGSIVYRYGRPDYCPGDDVEALGVELPSRSIGTADSFAYFRRVFNFTENETVAILGAHSLGVLHEMGTLRPLKRWTNNRPDKYSNEYYAKLTETNWRSVNASYAGVPYRLFEWQQRPAVAKRFMLNSDIGLVRRVAVSNSITGEPSCRNYTSCASYRTASFVRQLASNQTFALAQFLRAFKKMLENGVSSSLTDVVLT